jgi:ribulose kinase
MPNEILPVGAAIATISPEAASHLGLVNRPLAVQGGIDAHIGIVGADTMAPGRLLMIGGTSVVQLFQLPGQADVHGFWGPYPHALVDDHWLVEAGQVSAGSILSWYARDVFDLDDDGLRDLIARAQALPVGRSGLLTLDYFMGNRTPYRDPLLRGAVLGLSLGHDRAALYRSAVEAIALASAHVIRHMRALGITCDRIVTAGGYAKNPLWLGATVDAIGLPVELLPDANLTIIGAAGTAACGAGLVDTLQAGASAVAQPSTHVEPDPARHEQYAELLEEYLEATALLAPLSHRLATRQLGRQPDVR